MHGKFAQYEQIVIIAKVTQKQPSIRGPSRQMSRGRSARALVDDRVISEVRCQEAADVMTMTNPLRIDCRRPRGLLGGIHRPATDDHSSKYIRHRVSVKSTRVMAGRTMLRSVVIFAYLGVIVSVTCNNNHDVIKQVRASFIVISPVSNALFI